MNGNNLAFRSDPKSFLKSHFVMCYTHLTQQKNDINRMDGNTLPVTQSFGQTVEFDLVSNPMGYVDLKLLGTHGSFKKSSITRGLGYGDPVVGNYIPYLGQIDGVEAPVGGKFGKINLSRVPTNYVFTLSFSGCNFVITKKNGETFVYHEPTDTMWTAALANRYPGEQVVKSVGPAYDDDHLNGFGCLVRASPSRWIVYVQTCAMGQTGVTDLLEDIIEI